MRFTATELAIPGVLLINPRRFPDSGGYFMETYRAREFEQFGMPAVFLQDNQSFVSDGGTIRGLHYQEPPHAQSRLIRALRGAIFAVAVDLRRGSPSFAHWVGVDLTPEAGKQLFVPAGFAHGYCTLAPDSEVAFKCSGYNVAEADAGIRFSDPLIGVEWPVAVEDAIVAERDRALPLLEDTASPFAMELS